MNLQLFAEPGEGNQTPPQNSTQQSGTSAAINQPPTIDYDRIAQILEGKQAATEDSVLKGYFKQQGLSKDEAEQAIAAFKQQNQHHLEWYKIAVKYGLELDQDPG